MTGCCFSELDLSHSALISQNLFVYLKKAEHAVVLRARNKEDDERQKQMLSGNASGRDERK